MRAGLQNYPVRYAIAVFAVGGALIAQFLLKPYIGDKTPFVVFYLSIVISALFAGFGPGILSTVLSAAAASYFFIEPIGSFYPSTTAGLISLIIFITAGFSMSYLSRLRWRSEAALADQQERLKTQLDEMNALLDILPTGVWFANRDCSVLKGNAAAYKMLDLPPGINASFTGTEMELPKGLKLFVNGVETPPEEMPMQQVARTGKAMLNFEQEIHFHDGSKKIVYANVVPLFDQKGEVFKVVGVYTDFTERKQYEQALAETSEALTRERERLAVALRAGNLGVYEWQVGEETIWWAPETFLLYGVDPTTFVPTIENFNELVFPDDRQELWRKTEASLSGGSFFSYEYRIIRPDGQIRWIANRSQIAFGEDGKAARITGVAMDVTERRQAEKILRESEEKFRTLGEAIPNLAWLSDDQGRSLYVNPAWSNYTGLTIEQFNEQGWQALHPPEDLPQLEKAWNQALERSAMIEVETMVRRFDGVYRWFLARSIPLKDADGKIVRWVGTLTDIHELKQAEETLKEANSNKELFLATLAHELRNPLAPVRGGLEIIRRSLDDRATVERMLAIIERQTGQLYRLVDDLLDISRITLGKIKLQKSRFALDEAINLAIETSRGFIEKCGCTLSFSPAEETIWLDADLMRISQIVSNLLNNAARYNKPQGSIRLRTERLDEMAVIKVSDTGIGIPPAMLSNIFEPYNQVNGAAPQSGRGIGIGLSVVKRLVEMHGGKVTAASGGVGCGSEFVVWLPAVEEEIKAETASPNNIERFVEKSDLRRVLIVDDNEDAAAMLEFLLKTENYDVRTAFSGAKALETAAEFNPQIALLDIGLPDLTGYELAARLKKQFPALRLLAISGWGQEEDRRRSKEAGFDYHLVKPVEFDELQKLIHL